MVECEICGRQGAQLHHIVHRSTAPYMSNIKINFKYLCLEHHTGDKGPHNNKSIDIEYKLELQRKLFELFEEKDFYTPNEIKEKLKTTPSEVRKLVKTLRVNKEGYSKLDLIIHMMGDKLYAK
ncbi:hypothetical protein ACLD43_18620 [Clostridium botulinum]|uniref:hypothetical protein n=1 Tax=Clostridium botulinum TaxID=1491 RepID=UPI001DD826FD|nr:hypothetical protein [Clostridium botulinum]